jgi:hypothetical protein
VKDWQVDFLTNAHNGDNEAEIERIRAEHPNEEECILNQRVLGALAPTRCECLFFLSLGIYTFLRLHGSAGMLDFRVLGRNWLQVPVDMTFLAN